MTFLLKLPPTMLEEIYEVTPGESSHEPSNDASLSETAPFPNLTVIPFNKVHCTDLDVSYPNLEWEYQLCLREYRPDVGIARPREGLRRRPGEPPGSRRCAGAPVFP